MGIIQSDDLLSSRSLEEFLLFFPPVYIIPLLKNRSQSVQDAFWKVQGMQQMILFWNLKILFYIALFNFSIK